MSSWGRGGSRGGHRFGARGSSSHGGESQDSGSSRGRGGVRGRPPAHLRGKALGLWYRDQNAKVNKDRKAEDDAAIRRNFSCTLTSERQEALTSVIQNFDEMSYGISGSAASFQKRYQNNLDRNDQNNVLESPEDDDVHNRDYSNYIFTAKKDPTVDRRLQDELETKAESEGYEEMLRFRRKLPAYNLKDQIVDIVQKNQVVIISGETGCGKTTQVAQFILDSEVASLRGSECNIICTQPRRISAISVAERVARERDERLGDSVGYSIRLEHKFARRRSGKITFMTTGVIFQCLQGNPNLETVSHLIIDEVHERSIHSDFLITMLKDILVRRPNLKVILMSATMNAEEFSKYYNGAPIMNIPGFTYPITTYYLEDALLHSGFSLANSSAPSWNRRRQYEQQDYEYFIRPYIDELRKSGTYPPWVLEELQNPAVEEMNTELIQSLVEYICRTDTTNGAILIFVTGWDVISNLANSLEACGKFPRSRYRIFPLHSMMPTVNQREIFERPPPGVRKIVIATQIAETSITIDDILWVIDSGKIKLGNFDEKNNIATLDTEWVSIANAMQRRGRAGRVQEGHVYHLFTRARERTLEKFKKPEVLRTRLEEVILQIKILKLGKAEFLKRLLDPPSDLSVRLALERLHDLHALDEEERLTPLGFHLAQLPMDPQTGKMILMGAIFSCADPIFSIAASLSFKDPFFRPLGKEKEVDEIRKDYSGSSKSDHIVLHRAISGYEKAAAQGWGRKFCHQNFLSENTLKMLINMKEQFAGYLHKLGFLANSDYKCADLNRNSNSIGIITALTAAGLYPNVAKVNYMGRAGRVAVRCGNEKVQLHPGSVNVEIRKFESPYLVYYKKVKSSKIFLHDTTMVSPFALIFFGGQLRWKRPADEDQYSSVIVDGKFDFSYPKRQNFQMFVDSLRTELDKFLQHKVNNPGPTNWDKGTKEESLLNAIIGMITAEYEAFVPVEDEDEDDDGDGNNGGRSSFGGRPGGGNYSRRSGGGGRRWN